MACAVALIALFMSVSGCFRYVEADPGVVPEGEPVRIHLTREGMADLRELSSEVEPVVTGMVVRREEGRLLLHIPIGRRPEGFYTQDLGQNVVIPLREIVQLEQRRLDRVRTGLLTGASAVVVATVLLTIIDDAYGGPGEAPPDQEQMQGFEFPIRLTW
jgi:hypothetical protein